MIVVLFQFIMLDMCSKTTAILEQNEVFGVINKQPVQIAEA